MRADYGIHKVGVYVEFLATNAVIVGADIRSFPLNERLRSRYLSYRPIGHGFLILTFASLSAIAARQSLPFQTARRTANTVAGCQSAKSMSNRTLDTFRFSRWWMAW